MVNANMGRIPPKNLPVVVTLPLQQMHVATDVLVLVPDTLTYHLLGAGSLATECGPQDRHQTRSGSTTSPGILTKLRVPEDSTSQRLPGGAHSRTSPLWSNRDIVAENNKLENIFELSKISISISISTLSKISICISISTLSKICISISTLSKISISTLSKISIFYF